MDYRPWLGLGGQVPFSTILGIEGFDSVQCQQAGNIAQTLPNTRARRTLPLLFPIPGLPHLHQLPPAKAVH